MKDNKFNSLLIRNLWHVACWMPFFTIVFVLGTHLHVWLSDADSVLSSKPEFGTLLGYVGALTLGFLIMGIRSSIRGKVFSPFHDNFKVIYLFLPAAVFIFGVMPLMLERSYKYIRCEVVENCPKQSNSKANQQIARDNSDTI